MWSKLLACSNTSKLAAYSTSERLLLFHDRPSQLGRLLLIRGRFEEELAVVDLDDDLVLAFEVAAKQVFAERVFEMALDRATQRAGAVLGVGAVLDEEFLG